MNKRTPFIIACLWLLQMPGAVARDVVVEPQGEFAEIVVEPSTGEFKRLLKKDRKAIERVIANPGNYNPPVLYALSYALFETGRKDEAPQWFYLGQLRARSDANKSLDTSAQQGVDVMNQNFGVPINQYAMTDLTTLETTVNRVVELDAKLPRNYDPRWIALHGADAFSEVKVRFEPKSKWSGIDQRSRKTYLAEFHDILPSLKSQL